MARGNVRRACHAAYQDGDEDEEEDDDEDDDKDEDLDEEAAAARNTVVIRELNHDGSEMADTDVRPSTLSRLLLAHACLPGRLVCYKCAGTAEGRRI